MLKGRAGEKEAAEKKSRGALTATYKDGIVIGTEDGKNSMTINGRVHADYRSYSYDDEGDVEPAGVFPPGTPTSAIDRGADTYDIRRARIGVKARFLDYYEGEIVGNFGDSTNLDVAYLNIAWWKPVQFRIGQFKHSFSLEELTSSNNIDFIERSFGDALFTEKQAGAMVHGAPATGFTYALSVANGRGQNQLESTIKEDSKDITGRVTANIAEIMGNKDMVLHAGIAYSKGDIAKSDGEAAFGGDARTEARGINFFDAPDTAAVLNGDSKIDRSRLGLEGVVAYGPFKLQAQHITAGYDWDVVGADSVNEDIKTWYAQALWTITGESHASRYRNGVFSGLKPKNNFDPKTISGGAWEVGVRYSKFDASDFRNSDGTALANSGVGAGFAEADSITLGVKFVPNPHVRFMLDYVQTDFEEAIGGITGINVNNKLEDDEKAILFRTQFAF